MKCLYCHEIIDPSGKFCPKCGLPLNEDVSPGSPMLPAAPAQPTWSLGVKPLIALIGASLLGAFVGVSVGLMGNRAAPPDEGTGRLTNPGNLSAPVPVSAPLVPPTVPVAGALPAPAGSATGEASAPAPDSTAPAAAPSTPDASPTEEPQPGGVQVASAAPAEPPVLSDAEFEAMYADVWAGVSPRKRYTPPPPVVFRRPDPLPPSHRLAVNPFRQQGPAFVTGYWLPSTIQGVSGSDGPGPAEAAAQYEQQ